MNKKVVEVLKYKKYIAVQRLNIEGRKNKIRNHKSN